MSSPAALDFRFGHGSGVGSVAVTGDTRSIHVFGRLARHCTPFAVDGAVDRRGRSIDLVVAAGPTLGCDPVAPDAELVVWYEAVVHLPPDTYEVRVTHEWEDGSYPSQVVYEGEAVAAGLRP